MFWGQKYEIAPHISGLLVNIQQLTNWTMAQKCFHSIKSPSIWQNFNQWKQDFFEPMSASTQKNPMIYNIFSTRPVYKIARNKLIHEEFPNKVRNDHNTSHAKWKGIFQSSRLGVCLFFSVRKIVYHIQPNYWTLYLSVHRQAIP